MAKTVRGNRPDIEKRTGKALCVWPQCDPKTCRGAVGVAYILSVIVAIVCLGFGIECYFVNPSGAVCSNGNGSNSTDGAGSGDLGLNYLALMVCGAILVVAAFIPPVLFFARAGIANKNAGDLAKGVKHQGDRHEDEDL